MRLIRFEAVGLNHTNKIRINFDRRLTFLTGVNGSGKTSVLQAIIALVSPNLESLGSLNYREMTVEIDINGDRVQICSKKSNSEVSLSTSRSKSNLSYSLYEDDSFNVDDDENRRRYYTNLNTISLENKTYLSILDIPTPMFLGLDRRHAGGIGIRNTDARNFARRRKRNVFSSSLGDSIRQAVSLAEIEYTKFVSTSSKYKSEFVRDLLISLLDIPRSDAYFDIPSPEDRTEINKARRAISQFPRVEGITSDKIQEMLDPTLSHIINIVNSIPHDFNIGNFSSDSEESKTQLDSFLSWIRLKPTWDQITKVSNLINIYNARLAESSIDIDNYISMIDNFFNQTGKSLGFDASGRIEIRTDHSNFGVEDLSSGEAQLFVLLTHLAFNPYARQAGVFVIDEPEVSLHLFWQEILTNSLLEANTDLQYIMATHSPSIIGKHVNNAIDISN